MKRLLSLLCAFALLCSCLTYGFADAGEETSEELEDNTVTSNAPIIDQVTSLETLTVPLYLEDVDTVSEIDLTIINGIRDDPYISLDSIIETLNKFAEKETMDGFSLSPVQIGNTVYWLRDNDSMVTFDFDADTISFSNPDQFFQDPSSSIAMDISSPAKANEDGDVRLYTGKEYFYRSGNALTYELGNYNIKIFMKDGMGYIPLQTFSDVFLSGFLHFSLFNGQSEIITNESMSELTVVDGEAKTVPTELGEIYYAAENGKKSDELTIFNYQELCMALDYTYGLMDEHSIDSFDDLFRDTGLILKLKSKDAADTYYALTELTLGYFDDGHSAVSTDSYLVPLDAENTAVENTCSFMLSYMRTIPASLARRAYYPNGIVGYEEVGNTAYITFDHFVMDDERDYYNTEITNNADDVIELLIYANQQISREDSPIENVVLDISQNGGGQVDVALCVMSWFVSYAEISLVDVKTGAQADISYKFDANLDHQIDASDALYNLMAQKMNLHLYCLIGEGSFSCGNMVPAFFKNSGCVTLIGRTSGGGACSVQPMSTADGCAFQISSRIRANFLKNGTFYSVDEGVTPDIYIDKYDHLYDRTYLTNLINNLD